MNKSKIVFEKLALSSALLMRYINKANTFTKPNLEVVKKLRQTISKIDSPDLKKSLNDIANKLTKHIADETIRHRGSIKKIQKLTREEIKLRKIRKAIILN